MTPYRFLGERRSSGKGMFPISFFPPHFQDFIKIMAAILPILLCIWFGLYMPSIGSFPVADVDSESPSSSYDYYLPTPQKVHCASNSYPPAPSNAPAAPSFVVDLDAPPEKRWGHVMKRFIKPLKGLTLHLDEILKEEIRYRLGSYFPIKFFFPLI